MALIALVIRVFRLIVRENSIASARQVVITFLVPNAESPRSMILPAPHLRVVVIACFTWEAAARPDPALPLRSRASASTRAAVAVHTAVLRRDTPLPRTPPP